MEDIIQVRKPIKFFTATYELDADRDDKALEDVKEILELSKNIPNVKIILSIHRDWKR